MKYFDILPKIDYEFTSGKQTLPDLFSRVAFTEQFLSNMGFVYQEKQENPSRPENTSINKYDSFDFYWLLLLANNIYDINTDWPKIQESFGIELNKLNNKRTYYLYENADIFPYDILYVSETSYGVIESWNPSYKQLVLTESYNLPTTNLNSVNFYIKRVLSDNSIVNVENYCLTETFTCFGSTEYRTTVNQIKQGSKILNPFLKINSGDVNSTGELLLDVCDSSDKTAFQNSLIYKVVNNQTVNNIIVETKELEFLRQYSSSLNLNILQPDIVGALESKIKIMLNDRSETANTITRIG